MSSQTPASSRSYWESIARGGPWAGYYDRAPDERTYNFFTRRECVFSLLAGDGGFRRMLDIGCGTADYAPLAARHGAEYVGIDYSLAMIEQAVDRTDGAAHPRRFAVGAGDRISFAESSFDLVIALGYIEYFVDPSETLDELRRVMAPGGTLVMQSFKWDLLGSLRRRWESARRGERGPDRRLPEDWVDKKYQGPELDAVLARFDFERTDHTYNNFYLLPEPVRRRWPKLYMSTSEAVGRLAPRLFGFTAVNYIAKYRLRKAGA
jgi:ubiquinone/menaquinone biosynthesis C-methylase UbiE